MQFDISEGQVDIQVGMAVRDQRWNKTVGGQTFGDFFRGMAFEMIGTVDVKVPISFNLGTLSPSDFPALNLSPVVTFKYALCRVRHSRQNTNLSIPQSPWPL